MSGVAQHGNWFESGGLNYARFRPSYPAELVRAIVEMSPRRSLAIDVGCGTGQFSWLLGEQFQKTIGIDPTRDQISHATAHPRVEYVVATAEQLPVADGSVDLITVAQAAHWFDLDVFYREVRRIASDEALLALVSYDTPVLEPPANERFWQFYSEELEPYWPPERRLVDEGYQTIGFPFEEVDFPSFSFRQHMTVNDFLGYIATWSAIVAVKEADQLALLAGFKQDLQLLWGESEISRLVTWPINTRIGVI